MSQNNGKSNSEDAVQDVMVKVPELQWHPMIENIDFKLLRVSEETGSWTIILRCQAGSYFPLHRHYGAGEYFVIVGRMLYRAGEAKTGDYGYEPLGAVHDRTTFPEYTELLFTNHGPVLFLNEEDGSVKSILDHETIKQMTMVEPA